MSDFDLHWKCSHCGARVGEIGASVGNKCPNCGARFTWESLEKAEEAEIEHGAFVVGCVSAIVVALALTVLFGLLIWRVVPSKYEGIYLVTGLVAWIVLPWVAFGIAMSLYRRFR